MPPVSREHAMPGATSTAPYLHDSTYGSWSELGRWYAGLIRHQAIPDARIREKAAALTKGIRDERERVAAIYGWVVTATRYVGLEHQG